MSWWVFNCYVVHDGGAGRPLVVDVGLMSGARWVRQWLAANRVGREPVVVATHGHADHVGGLPLLVEHLDAIVVMPSRIRDYLDGELPRSPGLAEVARIGPVLADQPRMVRPLIELARTRRHIGCDGRGCRMPITVDGWLVDGETVPGAPDWQVLSVPGHTDDSTALHNPTTGVLISGDAVLSAGGRAWFTPELVDVDLARATEDRLRSLPISVLLPGHGRPVVGRSVFDHALGPDERPGRGARGHAANPSRGG